MCIRDSYSANVNYKLGNNIKALEEAKMALNMEPNNIQYQRLVDILEGRGSWYNQQQRTYGYPSGGINDYCCQLCMLNLACNCCCNGGMVSVSYTHLDVYKRQFKR